MSKVNSEKAAPYIVKKGSIEQSEQKIIEHALDILKNRMIKKGDALASPGDTISYLKLAISEKESEVFGFVSLDNRNRTIAINTMFHGTIDGASVYPREVVKQGLKDNAAAVILFHNHPSGIAEPSQADIQITERLKKALSLVDIRVLDHVIVGDDVLCFSERGLI
jgi:DNA repair protein RadC